MRRLLGRRTLPLAIAVALVATAAVALAQVGGAPRARAAAISDSGSFQIGNSRDGAAIFSATGIAPGGGATGTVTIRDEGSGPIALTLHRGELLDTPGLGGGVLSGRLGLTIADVTGPGAPRTVYAGPLATMPDLPAGELAAGEARTFRFTAALPDEGSASFQNAVQGAATTVAYSWVAAEVSGGGGGGSGGSGGEGSSGSGGSGGGTSGAGGPGAGGGAPPPGSGVGATRGDQTLNLTVPKIRRAVRGGQLVVWTTCDLHCRLSVRGRVRAIVAGRHRGARIHHTEKALLAPGPHRVRIPLPRSLRRWLRATPGPARVRAGLRFLAVGTGGQRSAVRRTVRLRVRRPAPPPSPGQTPPQGAPPG